MYNGLDERELAVLCSQRDRQAEDELYMRYAAKLLTLCRRYTDDADEARDLMHDSIIKALDRISSFTYRGRGSLYAWLSRIAVNSALNNVKRYKLRFVTIAIPDSADDPPEDEIEAIPQEILLDMISALPHTQRAVFNLFCIEGYSHREIAEMLGISEKGSASLLAKARTRLKKKIDDYIKNSG